MPPRSFHSSSITFQPAITTTPRHLIVNDDELDAIIATAQDCSEHSQCTIDDVSGLLLELKDFQSTLEGRVDNVNKMIAQLQHLNANEERKTDEVRSFVRDMLRVFDSGSHGHYPISFSGDVGDGPTTAYDALPPKQWKKV